jgi:hypothetical protein
MSTPPSQKGKKRNDETRRLLRESHKGPRPWRIGKKIPKNSGKNHVFWKGDNVGYIALHAWVARQLGKPKHCSYCHTETAKKFEWANISGCYKREISDWVRLCTKCHRLFDYGKIKLFL